MNSKIISMMWMWVPPILTIVLGIFIGWLVKRIIHKRLTKFAKKTKWKGDDIFLSAIESHIILWFFLASLYLVSNQIQFGEPLGQYLGKLAFSALVLSVTFATSRLLTGMLDLWADGQSGSFPSTKIFTNLIRITVITIGVLTLLQSLDVSVTSFLTALGVGGLAISLALKDTLADLFSGLHILLSQKVKPGDFIQLDSGEMGYVSNITWRNTTLIERTNNIVSIPNSRLSTAIIRNYDTRESSFRVTVPVGVAYDSDLDHVERVTKEIAMGVVRDVDGAVEDDEPIVRFQAFADSSINFMVYFQGKAYGDHHPIIHEFVKRLHKRFDEENIEIPFPIRTIVQKDEK